MSLLVFCSPTGSTGVTTTALQVAALAPGSEPVVFAELDSSGGDLAGWLETGDRRGIASMVTTSDRSLDGLGPHLQRLPSGLPVLVAPALVAQAKLAVREVSTWLPALFAAGVGVRVVADAGRVDPTELPAVVRVAGLVVIVVRQSLDSGPGSVPRVDRARELVDAVDASGVEHALVVIGAGPYAPADIARHTGSELIGVLPEDARGAATGSGAWTIGRAAGRSLLAGATRDLSTRVMARLDTRIPVSP